jgi:hypothetical protein
MTSLATFDGGNLGVLVTGRIGHGGSDSTSFLELMRSISEVFPSAEVAFSTSSEPGKEIRRHLAPIDCTIAVREFWDDPTLTYGMNSLIRQTQQAQFGLKLFSSAVQHVIRIRSDWLITNQGNLKEFVFSSLQSASLTFLDVNWPKFPWMPNPWQGNDYVTLGDVQSVSRFWAPFGDSEIRANKKTRSLFSRQFHYYGGCNEKSVEQMLFRRYFGALLGIRAEGNFLSELYWWASSDQWATIIPYRRSGVSPPSGALSRSRIAKVFFGRRAVSKQRPIFAIQLVTGYLIGAWFFWLHPMWAWPRLRTKAASSR